MSWGGVGQYHCDGSVTPDVNRGQQPAVRPIAVAHRGSSGSMQQGTVWVAHNGARDVSLSSSVMGHITPVIPT